MSYDTDINNEELKPVHDEVLEAVKPVEGAVLPEVEMTPELKEAVLTAFNNESSIKFLIEDVKDEDAVVILGVNIPKHQVVEILQERIQNSSDKMKEDALNYFRENQALLPIILVQHQGFTELTLEDGPVNISNASLIGWFEEDEELGPIIEELAGRVLEANGFDSKETIANGEDALAVLVDGVAALIEKEEPPVIVEEPSLNNQVKFGIA